MSLKFVFDHQLMENDAGTQPSILEADEEERHLWFKSKQPNTGDEEDDDDQTFKQSKIGLGKEREKKSELGF